MGLHGAPVAPESRLVLPPPVVDHAQVREDVRRALPVADLAPDLDGPLVVRDGAVQIAAPEGHRPEPVQRLRDAEPVPGAFPQVEALPVERLRLLPLSPAGR